MALAELRIENVRCIESASLEFSPELNLIAGENGAGKTSVLEAIFLLGRGRSFRTRSSERLIRHHQSRLTVFGRSDHLSPRQAGIEISADGGTRARIDGENAQSLLELSGVFPVQAIDPEIHKLVDQGPERRRRWLDWLVFHVEPTFASQWARYNRALKQRNAALKTAASEIGAWDAELIRSGEAITDARRRALDRLLPRLAQTFRRFGELEVNASFLTGWAADTSLADSLRNHAERDRQRGTTTSGPHRADVNLRRQNRVARETLSRGQQKLTAIAMIVSQLQLLQDEQQLQAILLLDDPAAELDAKNLQRLFDELASLKCQMIATSLTPETALFQAPKATFHVEQGRVLKL
ncbi:MAG TPA: DNA replication/repair protein RecF [Steroidobacteraceae bacterium]|nr:DNA replication/repair protein RecF [Steroidobacteraceae bacterium]